MDKPCTRLYKLATIIVPKQIFSVMRGLDELRTVAVQSVMLKQESHNSITIRTLPLPHGAADLFSARRYTGDIGSPAPAPKAQ